MKKKFALLLLLSSPLFAMNKYPSAQETNVPTCLTEGQIDTYLEMVRNAAANGRLDQLKLLKKFNKHQFEEFLNRSNELGATSLYYACQNGHTEVVKYLLEEKAMANQELMLSASSKEKSPCTPLHIAAGQGHLEILEMLLKAESANVNSQHAPKKRTPLHYAIAQGHTKVAALLLTKKANYILEDEDKNTPLSLAAKCEFDPALTEALSKGNILKAAYDGLAREISGFIAIKANLEETSAEFKATPLIWAANNGHANVVKLLLDAGANIHAQNRDGLTALDCARKRGKHEAVAVLEEALINQSNHHLITAAKEGDIKSIETLIASKADLEIIDNDWKATPLMWAANYGNPQAVSLLIKAGANLYAKNAVGKTALDCARGSNVHEVVAVLEEALKKAQTSDDKGKEDIDNKTPLNLTHRVSSAELITLLSGGRRIGNSSLSELIAQKANLEVVDDLYHATPLMWAANNGHKGTVKLLLAAGANIHAQNTNGLTALDCARIKKHTRIESILRNASIGSITQFSDPRK